MTDEHPAQQAKKFPSILRKKVPDEYWRLRFLNKKGQEIFRLDPYVLHGPNPSDRGLAEIKGVGFQMMASMRNISTFRILHLETRF